MSQEESKKPKTVKQQVTEKHERCPAQCPKVQVMACETCGGSGLVLVGIVLNYTRELEVKDS